MKITLYVVLFALFLLAVIIVVRECNGSHPYQDGYRQGEQAGRQDYGLHHARETEAQAKKEVAAAGESDMQFADGYWAGYQAGYPK